MYFWDFFYFIKIPCEGISKLQLNMTPPGSLSSFGISCKKYNTSCRLTNLTLWLITYFQHPYWWHALFLLPHLNEGIYHFDIPQHWVKRLWLMDLLYVILLKKKIQPNQYFKDDFKTEIFTKVILYHAWNLRPSWKTLSREAHDGQTAWTGTTVFFDAQRSNAI